jgi:hypothetical protein
MTDAGNERSGSGEHPAEPHIPKSKPRAIGDEPAEPLGIPAESGAAVDDRASGPAGRGLGGWWLRPGLPSGRAWAAGPGYFGGDHFAAYERQVAYPEAVTGQVGWRTRTGGRRVTRAETSWEQIIGGPVDQPRSRSQFSQLDWFSGGAEAGGTMFANAFKRLTAAGRQDTAWLFLVVSMIPETHATEGGNPAVWHEIAHGRYDDEYEVMGYRLGRNMTENGWSKDWLILRPNHEMNQSNVYRVYPDTRALYRAAMETAFQKLREGYGQRLRIVHSPGRRPVIGPFED